MMRNSRRCAPARLFLHLILLAHCEAWVPSKTVLLPSKLWADVSNEVEAASPSADVSTEAAPSSSSSLASLVQSVNFFISRKCNYSCKFCFHTAKTSHHLTIEQAKIGIRLLKDAGTQKVNFAGGEPFLHPELLGELCKTCYELELAVSIISNGSLITGEWMEEYGRFVDVLGVSVDSFDDATNFLIGRGETDNSFSFNSGGDNQEGGDATTTATKKKKRKNKHVERILNVRKLCTQHNIVFKLNTVVCSLNHQEDMNDHVRTLDPYRWKVFQVLLLKDENMGHDGNLRDATDLVVTRDQFDDFVERHDGVEALIPESNDVMQNSYLLLDEDMCFLDCSGGGKVPGESILKVGVAQALMQAGFDQSMFEQRGGVYDWKRERGEVELGEISP